MNTIKEKATTPVFRNACIALIWLMVFYSSIIQNVVKEIPYGMLILGISVLLFYILNYSGDSYDYRREIPEESIYMLVFMAYMFIFGTMVAIDRSDHLSQAITCLQYLFVLIVISSLIKGSGTDSFHFLLLVKALILAALLLIHPVVVPGERYSISEKVNPNGLGMELAAGIWAILYRQQRKKLPLVFVFALIAVLGYCIVQTGSRKSLIAAGLTIFLWLIFCFLPGIKEKGGLNGIISLFVMGALIVVIGFLFTRLYSDSTIANRMGNLFYEAQEGNRSKMYSAGIGMIKSNPLFGIGFQGFKHSYGLYSHATIVEIPVSGGILGTLLYFGVYFFSIKKTIILYRSTKGVLKLNPEHSRIKMILVLWVAMLFYTTCIIHPYQFDSYILFGIIFGETAYIERRLITEKEEKRIRKTESIYLKA